MFFLQFLRYDGMIRIRIRICDLRIPMQIREAQKHTDPDPEHWYIYIILRRKKVIRKSRFSLLFLLYDGRIRIRLMDPDANPGGPKTFGSGCGSGSTKLLPLHCLPIL